MAVAFSVLSHAKQFLLCRTRVRRRQQMRVKRPLTMYKGIVDLLTINLFGYFAFYHNIYCFQYTIDLLTSSLR